MRTANASVLVADCDAGRKIVGAIEAVLTEGAVRTADLGGTAGTREFTDAVIAKL